MSRWIWVVFLLFAACGEGEPVRQEMDRSGRPLAVTVYVHTDPAALENGVPGRAGYAEWTAGRCELHVPPPVFVDGEVTMTWGHELMHCIYGRYHAGEYPVRGREVSDARQ